MSAALTAWAHLLLGSLAAAGVREVICSPGSRSTPFVLAAARTPGLVITDLIDERSAAFYALGQARVTGRPSLLLCTSGTAGAHYLPAAIEASQAGLPLIVLTADRPYALQGCDAPQTIDQRRLYGDFVRAAVDLGMPDLDPGSLAALRRVASQAVHQSRWPLPGPVHLNARAARPLEPAPGPALDAAMATATALLAQPLPRAYAPVAAPDRAGLVQVAAALSAARRPILVAGPSDLRTEMAREMILSWCPGLPLLVEATSQLRFGPGHAATRIGAFDLLLRDPELRARQAPDLVLQLGAPPTSGLYDRWLGELPGLRRVVIRAQGWSDPQSTADLLLAEPAAALAALKPPQVDPAWTQRWADAEAAAWAAVDAELSAGGPGELGLARAAILGASAGAQIVLGNSLPIRDVDLAVPPGSTPLQVLCQRGANGIDGLVSGAAGAAAAGARPTLLLLGDVSLLHDLGGLAAAAQVQVPLVIVVLNNGGGRIFEQLPLARTPGLTAQELRHWTTPHAASFQAAAAVFGLRFEATDQPDALEAMVRAALGQPGATLIEAVAPPDSHARQVAAILARMRAR